MPRSVIECLARGFHCLLNIFAISFRHLCQNFAGGGIVGGKGFSRSGGDPFAIDQNLPRLLNEISDTRMNLWGNCDAHMSSLNQADTLTTLRCRTDEGL